MSALDDWNARRAHEKKRTRERKTRPVTPVHVRKLPCAVCGNGPTQVHHIVPRSSFGSASRRWMNEPENLMPLCERCHVDHHTSDRRVPRHVLSPAAVEFVRRMKGEGWLDRWYPVERPTARVTAICGMCGKDEADEIGVIIEGVCGDCRQAWR